MSQILIHLCYLFEFQVILCSKKNVGFEMNCLSEYDEGMISNYKFGEVEGDDKYQRCSFTINSEQKFRVAGKLFVISAIPSI